MKLKRKGERYSINTRGRISREMANMLAAQIEQWHPGGVIRFYRKAFDMGAVIS